MKLLVAHNAVDASETDPSTLDVLEQVRFISEALARAGHRAEPLPFDRNLRAVLERIERAAPDMIFNLVESVEGDARLHPAAAAFFELLGIAHTGSPARALEVATDKHLSKALLRAAGMPTPEWASCGTGEEAVGRGVACYAPTADGAFRDVPPPWILKPTQEDASIGIDEDSVVRDPAALPGKLAEMQKRFPTQPILVERYIEGREFNVSLLAARGGPQALPVAEIVFDGYGPGKERVVGFRAKWDSASPEYKNTRRSYDHPAADAALIERIRRIGVACWGLFGLRGYARVDLRVDARGEPYVIEVNTNPCLSPDAGFAAAAERAAIPPERMVQHILEDAVCLPRQRT